jgi:hypothetical protein
MALSRRAKITAGAVGLTAAAFFGATGSALAADGEPPAELVIVEPANAPAIAQSDGECADKGSSTSTVADSR